jgi:Mg2+ and Co2+ transporter CorA
LNEPVAVEMSADEYKAMIELAKTLVLMSVKCVDLNKQNKILKQLSILVAVFLTILLFV